MAKQLKVGIISQSNSTLAVFQYYLITFVFRFSTLEKRKKKKEIKKVPLFKKVTILNQ